jgi:N-acetylglucosaminyltransferase
MADQLVVAALRVVFLLYVTLVLVHSTLERLYALRSRRQRRAEPPRPAEPDEWPAVDVVIPCFNEDPALLEACCRSVAGQDYPGPLQVWLVDDGSANRGELLGVYERWGERGWTVRLLDRNTGKRAAQDEAVRRGGGELVVLMDSDTVLAPDAVRQAATCFADDRVGAVSGSIGVLNAPTNLLTRLIHHRYRLRFQVERPAQGFFTSLLCCSGPFAVYRRSLLAGLWPRYLTQTFAGVRCTNGDDLHLTNLVLATGRQVLFEPRAMASTWCRGRCRCTCASSCAGTAASTGSCAGPSRASAPGIPIWPWTCSLGPCCPCCWPPRGCWWAGSCWPPISPWPWPCCA